MVIYIANKSGDLNIGESVNGWAGRYPEGKERHKHFLIKEIDIGTYKSGFHTDTPIHNILNDIGAHTVQRQREIFIANTICSDFGKAVAIVEYIINGLYLYNLSPDEIKKNVRRMKRHNLSTVSFENRSFNKAIINQWLSLNNKKIKCMFAYPRAGKSITTAFYLKEKGYKNVLIVSGKPSEIKDAWENLPNRFIDFIDMSFDIRSIQGLASDYKDEITDEIFTELKDKLTAIISNYDAVVFDEFQWGCWHDKYTNQLNSLGKEVVLCTGTPYVPAEIYKTIDKKNVAVVKYDTLVENKICVPSIHYYLESKDINEDVYKLTNDQLGAFLNDLFDSQSDFYRCLNHALVVTKNDKSSKRLEKYINDNFSNIKAKSISGAFKSQGSLEKTMNNFIAESNGTRTMFITCNRGTCGVSIPKLNYLIWLVDQVDMSINKFQQANARPTMLMSGKDVCRIFYISPSLAVKATLKHEFNLDAQGLKKQYTSSQNLTIDKNNLLGKPYDPRIGKFQEIKSDMEFKEYVGKYLSAVFSDEIYYERIQNLVSIEDLEKINWDNVVFDGKKTKDSKESVYGNGKKAKKVSDEKKPKKEDLLDDEDEIKLSELELKKEWFFDMLYLYAVAKNDLFIEDKDNLNMIKIKYKLNKNELDEYYKTETIESEKFVKTLFRRVLTSQQRYYTKKDFFDLHFGKYLTGKVATPNLDFWLFSDKKATLVNFVNIFSNEEINIIESIYHIKFSRIDMKFTHLIMNPPYGHVHLPALKAAVENIVNKGGKVVSIQPVRWLQDTLAKLKQGSDKEKMRPYLENNIVSTSIINATKASELFGVGISMDLAIFHLESCGGFDYDSLSTNNILEKVLVNKKKISDYMEKDKLDGIRIKINMIQSNGYSSGGPRPNFIGLFQTFLVIDGKINGKDWTTCIQKNKHSRNEGETIPFSIQFKTEKEANNFIDSTKTIFWKYLMLTLHRDVHVPVQYLPFMENYTTKWSDERFYKHFNITKEEQKIIENRVKENDIQ